MSLLRSMVVGVVLSVSLVSSVQALVIQASEQYSDGSYINWSAEILDSYEFVDDWNNEASGLSFNSFDMEAYSIFGDLIFTEADADLSGISLLKTNPSTTEYGSSGDQWSIQLNQNHYIYEWATQLHRVGEIDLNSASYSEAYRVFSTIDGHQLITTTVPEPASLALMSLGLVGLGFSRRKKAA